VSGYEWKYIENLIFPETSEKGPYFNLLKIWYKLPHIGGKLNVDNPQSFSGNLVSNRRFSLKMGGVSNRHRFNTVSIKGMYILIKRVFSNSNRGIMVKRHVLNGSIGCKSRCIRIVA